MSLRIATLSPALLLVAACAQTPADTARQVQVQQATQDDLQRKLAGLTPGKPTSCLPSSLTSARVQTQAFGSTLLYVAGRNLIYRNDTTGGCENAGRGDILVTQQYNGRACSGDIATTVDQYTRSFTGSCALRDFVPYSRPR
ncbi:hypothetical protein SAMN05192583_2703 [Sphingomonas gellani]|uniref:Lipoprotein n=1 Tax=Sphingomonas gellani TaxID=1166340 RepID=A0A1H8G4W3_9SPHN|nr:hypothetical protein [Sphingomonas gellani]SEN39032.1 hypothetical protein SAMN05192583_2703 [Sphingomonas gellani]